MYFQAGTYLLVAVQRLFLYKHVYFYICVIFYLQKTAFLKIWEIIFKARALIASSLQKCNLLLHFYKFNDFLNSCVVERKE